MGCHRAYTLCSFFFCGRHSQCDRAYTLCFFFSVAVIRSVTVRTHCALFFLWPSFAVSPYVHTVLFFSVAVIRSVTVRTHCVHTQCAHARSTFGGSVLSSCVCFSAV